MRKLLCFALVLFVLNGMTCAYAVDSKAETVIDKDLIYESLDEREKEIVGPISFDGSYDVKAAMLRLYENAVLRLKEKLGSELGFAMQFVGLAALAAVVHTINTDKKMSVIINMVCCSASALLLAGDVDSIVKQAYESILRLSDYSKAAMPAIFSAAAASGAPASSAAKYAAASMAIDLLISAANKIIIPFINLYICVSVSKSIFDNSIISALAKFVKWLVCSLMTAMTMAFTAYISFTGLVIGSVDAAAVKTTRTIIANGVPVVGKIISDASSLVLAGAALVKNTAGVAALLAVCALCISPFLDLAVKMLVFKAGAAFVEMLPSGKLSALLNDFGTAFGMLMGLLGCCGVMLFISIISGIKVLV